MSHAGLLKKKCCCTCHLLTPCEPAFTHTCTRIDDCCFSDEACIEVSIGSNTLSWDNPAGEFCCIIFGFVDVADDLGGTSDCSGPSYAKEVIGADCPDGTGECATDGDRGLGTSGRLSIEWDDVFPFGGNHWIVRGFGEDATEVGEIAIGHGSSDCCPTNEEVVLSSTVEGMTGTLTITFSLTNNRCCYDDPNCDEQVGEDDCDGGIATEECDGSEDSPCPVDAPEVKVFEDLSEYTVAGGGTGVIKVDGICYTVTEAANCDGAVSIAEFIEGIEELEDCEVCCAS